MSDQMELTSRLYCWIVFSAHRAKSLSLGAREAVKIWMRKKLNMRSYSLWRVHFCVQHGGQQCHFSSYKKVNESWLSQEDNKIQRECVS